MDEARAFSTTHLKNNLKQGINTKEAEQVNHALELPYHRRLQRLEARWYLEKYEPKEPHHQLLLELAKLDFNMVQLLHQKELQELSRLEVSILNLLPHKKLSVCLLNIINYI